MSTYVLMHGGWHGGWCWDPVAPLLRAAGHTVVAADLPAHGQDRAPLAARPSERYVPVVCDVLDAQAVPTILVGHSSGGMIVTAAARQRPDKVTALVYLAAFLLPAGVTPPELMAEDTESILASALIVDEERGTVTVRPERAREVFYADCSDEVAAWATNRLVPEPLVPRQAAAAAPSGAAIDHLPRVYVECLQDRALGPATQRRMYTALPCRQVYSLPSSHSPFLSMPERLAAVLLEIAATLPAS